MVKNTWSYFQAIDIYMKLTTVKSLFFCLKKEKAYSSERIHELHLFFQK